MNSWPVVEVGSIADVVMGQSPPGETYNNSRDGLPFFQGKADFGHRSPTARKWCSQPKRTAEPGDILLSVRAPVGPTNVASELSCIGRGLAAVRVRDDRVEQDYLRLFFKHHEGALALRGQGSTFDAIGRRDIERLEIPLPPTEEQRRIVRVLDEADRLRRLRAEADAKAARILPALFLKMFGDPATNPMRWPERTLGDLCQVVSGATPKTNQTEYWGGSIAWATPKDLSDLDGWMLQRTERTLTAEGYASCSATMMPEGAVLLSSRAPIGLVAVSGIPICTNQGFKSLVCGPEVDPWYVFAWCQLRRSFLNSLGHGATFKEVSGSIVKGVSLPTPPIADQRRFRARLERLHRLRNEAHAAAKRLDVLFSQMLNQAFSRGLQASGRRLARGVAEAPE